MTLAEFVQHVAVSSGVMALGVAAVAIVRYRYDVGHQFFRRLLLGYALTIGLIAVLSATANVTERRCTRNPTEFCRYNDSIPLMAVAVLVFVGTCAVRGFFLHFNR